MFNLSLAQGNNQINLNGGIFCRTTGPSSSKNINVLRDFFKMLHLFKILKDQSDMTATYNV